MATFAHACICTTADLPTPVCCKAFPPPPRFPEEQQWGGGHLGCSCRTSGAAPWPRCSSVCSSVGCSSSKRFLRRSPPRQKASPLSAALLTVFRMENMTRAKDGAFSTRFETPVRKEMLMQKVSVGFCHFFPAPIGCGAGTGDGDRDTAKEPAWLGETLESQSHRTMEVCPSLLWFPISIGVSSLPHPHRGSPSLWGFLPFPIPIGVPHPRWDSCFALSPLGFPALPFPIGIPVIPHPIGATSLIGISAFPPWGYQHSLSPLGFPIPLGSVPLCSLGSHGHSQPSGSF